MKNAQIVFRIPAESKADLEAWAEREGLTKSQLLTILITGEGPVATARDVLTQHAINQLAQLNMPADACEIVMRTTEAKAALVDLLKIVGLIALAQSMGKPDKVKLLEDQKAICEASFYRAYGQAVRQFDATLMN